MEEALVVVADAVAAAAVAAVAPIRQRYGERVLIVAADAAERIRRVAGASLFLSGAAAALPPPDASETEQIGVDAWNARVASQGKQRPGDGLPWDTPGFEAP